MSSRNRGLLPVVSQQDVVDVITEHDIRKEAIALRELLGTVMSITAPQSRL
jgi:hypothetical protein